MVAYDCEIKQDMCTLAGMCHCMITILLVEVFFECVASLNNIADIPSHMVVEECRVSRKQGF